MSELLELLMRLVAAVRRAASRRPILTLAAAGLAAAAVVMIAGGRVGVAASAVPYNHWLGLSALAKYGGPHHVASVVLVAGLGLLALVWLVALRVLRQRDVGPRALWALVGAWALPFVVGPPLLTGDGYVDVANGLLQRSGLSPYHHAPVALGPRRIVDAIDPAARGAGSVSGPLRLVVDHLAVAAGGGNVVASLLLLRALSAVAVVVTALLAARLGAPERRTATIGLVALNPAVLVWAVAGVHLDTVAVALLLGALIFVRTGRPVRAVVLAVIAAAFVQAFVLALPALVVAHALSSAPARRWRVAALDIAVAVATGAVATLVVAYGSGWAGNIDVVTHDHTPLAPASLLSDVVAWIVPGASFDDLAVGGWVTTLIAALTLAVGLWCTAGGRPLERTTGYALLGAGLLGPVLYPWFLLWGILVLAPAATRSRRDWVVALSVAACFLRPGGYGTDAANSLTAVGLALVVVVVVPRVALRRQLANSAGPEPDRVSAHP